MLIDSWFPVGFQFPDGANAKMALAEGADWQIYESENNSRVLVATDKLAERWMEQGLIEKGSFHKFKFGKNEFYALSSSKDHVLCPVDKCHSPKDKAEAISFADAFKTTRAIDSKTSLHDAIYVERYSRLLPTYSITNPVNDDVVFGFWLSGGVPVSINSSRRIKHLTSWLNNNQFLEVIAKSGLTISPTSSGSEDRGKKVFSLAGRPELEGFLKEHVIDIVENGDRYKALGINFPGAIILHGPPGCGKTFAIERLIEYLEWPSYQIEASSVASPYIHETSKKVAAVFENAMQNAPALVVIDEMEAFLTDRQTTAGSGQHHVEEVAEFLRRIPEAIKNQVLVIGMTNRIEMIDPAILRRGRFDHVVKVGMASKVEVESLLTKLLSTLPQEPDIDLSALSNKLSDRPLSDVAFVAREGARLAARDGKDKISQKFLEQAMLVTPSREDTIDQPRKIGFIWD